MKVLKFIHEIFVKFPLLMIGNVFLLIVVNVFNMCSLFTIGPLVDFLIHPGLNNVSPLTQKAIKVMNFFSVPVSTTNWLIIFVVFTFLSSVFQAVFKYFILKTKYLMLRNIMAEAFDDFFRATWQFFSSGKQGELLNTFTRELTVIGNAFGSIGALFTEGFQIIFFLAIPFMISWQVTLLSVFVVIVLVLPFVFIGKYGYHSGKKSTETGNQYAAVLSETFGLVKMILGYGNQRESVQKILKAFMKHAKIVIKWTTLSDSIWLFFRPISAIVVAVALFFAKEFHVPLSETTILLLALFQVAKASGNFVTQVNSLGNVYPSYEQIKRLQRKACSMKRVSGGVIFERFHEGIKLKDLSFSYSGETKVLNTINLDIQKGQMIAFVGKSGVGKSTLIDIILGFHAPSEGSIKYDDVDLSAYDLDSIRKKVGYVPQESTLFNISIRENLLWAKPEASDEQIYEAVKLAHADEFVSDFPEGLDTIVGDRGVRLSGGQLQRVALARAFLREPELLILDEATSSLDSHSERLIQDAIDHVSKKTTVVIIAHRLSTIKKADCIFVLDEGKVVEKGLYNELISREGCFFSMVKLQELK